jgi:hypothetical protein
MGAKLDANIAEAGRLGKQIPASVLSKKRDIPGAARTDDRRHRCMFHITEMPVSYHRDSRRRRTSVVTPSIGAQLVRKNAP